MIQEIVTYIIIGAALAYTFSGIFKKLTAKKKKVAKTDFKSQTFSMQHNCDDCSAECMLRNTVKPLQGKNEELCKKIEIKQKL
jgi:hypothetical protein